MHDKIKMWTDNVPVEQAALQQLRNVADLPFIHNHIAVMPDVHFGMGATVGSVIPTKSAIIPAAVGVDIGCGMCAVRTSLTASDLPDNLSKLRSDIERSVPVGFNDFGNSVARNSTVTLWNTKFDQRYESLIAAYPSIAPNKHPSAQLGTLGGGNHFIELCLDEEDRVWVMLHSGSRGIGNRIGTQFINEAKEEMAKAGIGLVDKNLSYVSEGSELFNDYVNAVAWAQEYALSNRDVMLESVLRILRQTFKAFTTDKNAINCHHNYVEKEHHFGEDVWLTRKGAVRARQGDLGIIPGSMGARSFIVEGKGNADSFNSCSHGAGRVMSRTEAKRTFTVQDHVDATEGVECRKDINVIDETPKAYKNIDDVMAAQADLVSIKHTLKQVLCVKG